MRALEIDYSSAVFVLDECFNIVDCSKLGRVLLEPIFCSRVAQIGDSVNIARFMFLDKVAQEFCGNWTTESGYVASSLRFSVANHPFDVSIRTLIGQLSCSSGEFRSLWRGCYSGVPSSGNTYIQHPRLTAIDLKYQVDRLPSKDGSGRQLTHVSLALDKVGRERLEELASSAA